MKKSSSIWRVSFIVLLGLTLAIGACAGGGSKTIKVGIVMPITGPNAATTRDHINGMMIVIDDVNNSGGLLGGRQIEVIKEDDRSQPSEGVSAVRKVITQDKVVAVLGNFNSSVCAATRDVTNEFRVPQLPAGCTSDSLPEGYPYFFRTNTNNSFQTVPFIRWLVRDQGRMRVAILLEFLGRQTMVEVALGQVVRLPSGEAFVKQRHAPKS